MAFCEQNVVRKRETAAKKPRRSEILHECSFPTNNCNSKRIGVDIKRGRRSVIRLMPVWTEYDLAFEFQKPLGCMFEKQGL